MLNIETKTAQSKAVFELLSYLVNTVRTGFMNKSFFLSQFLAKRIGNKNFFDEHRIKIFLSILIIAKNRQ